MKCALAVNHPKTHDRAILQNEMVNVKMVDINLDMWTGNSLTISFPNQIDMSLHCLRTRKSI